MIVSLLSSRWHGVGPPRPSAPAVQDHKAESGWLMIRLTCEWLLWTKIYQWGRSRSLLIIGRGEGRTKKVGDWQLSYIWTQLPATQQETQLKIGELLLLYHVRRQASRLYNYPSQNSPSNLNSSRRAGAAPLLWLVSSQQEWHSTIPNYV